MRICPQCGQRFSADYSYCLDDGNVLSVDSTDVPTQVITRDLSAAKETYSVSPAVYILVGCLATALAGAIFLLVRGDGARPDPASVERPSAVDEKKETRKASLPTSLVNTAPVSTAPAPPNLARPDDEISVMLRDWARASEARDIDSTMSHYADTIDFYRRKRASKTFVRNDKLGYYKRFQTASITLSNMSIQSSPDGKSASAAFDKEWIYDGNSRFSGKVSQRLGLQKIDGRWLIVAEKDAKVLYLNK